MRKGFRTMIASAVLLGLAGFNPASSQAETVAEFFKGQTITIHMGFPGDGFFAST